MNTHVFHEGGGQQKKSGNAHAKAACTRFRAQRKHRAQRNLAGAGHVVVADPLLLGPDKPEDLGAGAALSGLAQHVVQRLGGPVPALQVAGRLCAGQGSVKGRDPLKGEIWLAGWLTRWLTRWLGNCMRGVIASPLLI